MTDQKYKLVPVEPTEEMFRAIYHRLPTLALNVKEVHEALCAAIAAAPEPVCRWKPLQGYSGMYFQGCVNDPEKHRARMIHGGDKFCARCGKRIEVEVVSDE